MTVPTGEPVLPIYLGPALSRWRAGAVSDVAAAINDGTLRERHWLDVKAVAGGSDGAKKKLARDLASFAKDGGALLIGVREDKPTQTLTVEPVLLDGLAEMVDQVARSRCDPPLYVVCHPLVGDPDPDGRARGVLLVEVPPSPTAPHMTDGRYYGRGDTTRHQLTDGDVARSHAVRTARQLTAQQEIAAEIARDPVPPDLRELSHLHVVAKPLASPPDLLTSLIGSQELNQIIKAGEEPVPQARSCSPHWGYLLTPNEPRAEGSGFCSPGLYGRRFAPIPDYAKEGDLLDVEIQDDGRVTLFCGRASDVVRDDRLIADAAVVVLTRCLITLAGQLGARGGYAGRWLVAVGIDDLAGKLSSNAASGFRLGGSYPPFSADTYVQGTETGTTEMLDRPGAVTSRLVRRLLRSLGNEQDQRYDQLLADR